MEEYMEYSTFTVTGKDGREIELAVVDEFEFEKKTYIAAALIEGDRINEDGVYIYRAKLVDDEIKAEKIQSPVEYKRVIRAYEEIDDESGEY